MAAAEARPSRCCRIEPADKSTGKPSLGIVTRRAMATNRMEILLSMVANNPQDSFARYGLAMEYARNGDLESAISEYRELIGFNPDYAAAYFHGGQALEKLGRMEEARKIYEQGIEVTSRNGDQHTRSELQAALDMLPL
jgi:tetratricopeptide (TPR) repeat protein